MESDFQQKAEKVSIHGLLRALTKPPKKSVLVCLVSIHGLLRALTVCGTLLVHDRSGFNPRALTSPDGEEMEKDGILEFQSTGSYEP